MASLATSAAPLRDLALMRVPPAAEETGETAALQLVFVGGDDPSTTTSGGVLVLVPRNMRVTANAMRAHWNDFVPDPALRVPNDDSTPVHIDADAVRAAAIGCVWVHAGEPGDADAKAADADVVLWVHGPFIDPVPVGAVRVPANHMVTDQAALRAVYEWVSSSARRPIAADATLCLRSAQQSSVDALDKVDLVQVYDTTLGDESPLWFTSGLVTPELGSLMDTFAQTIAQTITEMKVIDMWDIPEVRRVYVAMQLLIDYHKALYVLCTKAKADAWALRHAPQPGEAPIDMYSVANELFAPLVKSLKAQYGEELKKLGFEMGNDGDGGGDHATGDATGTNAK
jgi:hypothetical protein